MTSVFIDADNGGLSIYEGAGNLIAEGIQTAKTFKYVMDDHGIDPDTRTIYFTSSMDFADENCFEHYDDAKILASEGFKLMSMTREEG